MIWQVVEVMTGYDDGRDVCWSGGKVEVELMRGVMSKCAGERAMTSGRGIVSRSMRQHLVFYLKTPSSNSNIKI